MKILMLYNARSGTNSIAAYFMKQNPEYTYYNQPWSLYNAEPGIVQIPYSKSIEPENLFIKNEFSNLKTFKITKETILNDFDKIILLARRDKREQAISSIIAQKNLAYLNKEKKKYYIDGLDETQIRNLQTVIAENEIEMQTYLDHGAKMFYYEDLFYGEGFSELFQFLNLKHIQEDFDTILDSKNRYKAGEMESKQSKTLI